MRWMYVALVVAAAGLAGCDGAKVKTAANPIHNPSRKAGLWEQTSTVPGVPPQTLRICSDPSVDATLPWWGGDSQVAKCTQTAGKPMPDGTWTFESRCDMGGAGKTGLTGVGSGDFNGKYQVTIKMITAGSGQPTLNGRREVTNKFEWKGACPADWSPGDIEVAGGTRVNHDPGAVGRVIAEAQAALKQQEAEAKALEATKK